MAEDLYRDMVSDLCDATEGLSSWECDFASSCYDWDGQYTEKQMRQIEKIWDKVFG